jgi:5-methylcytosine-specific restriction protein A
VTEHEGRNACERNLEARRRCIEHYGARCVVCGLDFGKVYGEVAEGLIHVHHLKPISEVGESYVIDPVEDLRPVCPNCHAVIHLRREPPYLIEDVISFLNGSVGGRRNGPSGPS